MASPLLDALLEQSDFSRKSRLPSLFSDFSRLAQSNRDGYDANVKAWITALASVRLRQDDAESGCLCIVADTSLAEALASRQWGRPLALATVESEARNRRVWIPVKQFLAQTESLYHVPSLFERLSIGSVARWGLSKVWASSAPRQMSGTVYVCVANLEHVGEKIVEQLQSMVDAGYSGHITTTALLADRIAKTTGFKLNKTDMQVMLRFLARDKSIISQSSDVIKFLPESLPKTSERTVSETDLAVAQLKSTLSQLSLQIAQLSGRLDSLTSQIKSCVQKKQKNLALSALRTRNLIDRQLDQRTDNLHTLEQILLKIDDSANTVGILKAMEGGSQALAEMMKQVGGIDRVDQVLDQVQEQMSLSEEIGQAVGSVVGTAALDIDQDEIEAEWQAMVKEREMSDAAKALDATQLAKSAVNEHASPAATGDDKVEHKMDTTTAQESDQEGIVVSKPKVMEAMLA